MIKQNLTGVPDSALALIKLFSQQQEFKKVNQIRFFFFSKPSTGFPSLLKLNPYSLHGLQCVTIWPLKPSLPSYLVPSAFLCLSTLTFSLQHSKLVLSQSPSLTILPSRNVLSRSLAGCVLLLRSLVPSSCLRETISVHLTSSPLKKKILIKYA